VIRLGCEAKNLRSEKGILVGTSHLDREASTGSELRWDGWEAPWSAADCRDARKAKLDAGVKSNGDREVVDLAGFEAQSGALKLIDPSLIRSNLWSMPRP